MIVTSTHLWNCKTKYYTGEAPPNDVEIRGDDYKLIIDHDFRTWYKNGQVLEMDFIDEFERIYMMFGIINHLNVENGTFDQAYDLIFNIEIPSNIEFVDSKDGQTFNLVRFVTVGDIIRYYGFLTETNLTTRLYYEYPTALFLYIGEPDQDLVIYENDRTYYYLFYIM